MNSQTPQQTINLEELGVTFVIPSGWTPEIQDEYMFLKHDSISGLIVIFENKTKSTNKLLILANKGIEDEGVALTSLNDFKITSENTVIGHYQGVFMDYVVKAYAIGKINGLGSGVTILAIAEPKDFNDILKDEAEKLNSSIVFKEVKLSAKTQFWTNRLVGKSLRYFNTKTDFDYNGNTSTGISDKEIINLFNDGSFYYYINNQSIVQSETLRNENRSSGDFRIITYDEISYLQLFFNGNTLEFKLTLNSEKNTLLNGRRYLVVDRDD
ncbi:hypothetical protein AAFN75_01990 [Algibacter sp. AS12]|uniref:hypothetical protein n=1 Tax=Algibacter sp. AS12 TaxID=3135773 RepID=UPI00398B7BB3